MHMLLSSFGSLKHVSSCVNLVLTQKLAAASTIYFIRLHLIFHANSILEFLGETDVDV
jgi:hypothetical protein